MSKLSASQLLLLDNLIYLNGVANARKDSTIKEIFNDLLSGGLDQQEYPFLMSI